MNEYLPEGLLLESEKNKKDTSCLAALERVRDTGAIIEGVVTLCDHRFNLHIDLGGGIRGIMPREEVQYAKGGEAVKDIAILTRVGKAVACKVIGFLEQAGKTVAVLSRRAAQEECYLNYISGLTEGDIIRARVTHLENFGAFVDIGCGIPSLLSIDTISVSRIAHPSARLREGDLIYSVVKLVDDGGRIFVSTRELLGTWEENAALFSQGETVRGIVRSVESYGVFIELMPNLAGLAEYTSEAVAGQSCAVYIKSIIPEKMKIKLIIIDLNDSITAPSQPEYFIDVDRIKHIDSWQYSPSQASRVIESVFS